MAQIALRYMQRVSGVRSNAFPVEERVTTMKRSIRAAFLFLGAGTFAGFAQPQPAAGRGAPSNVPAAGSASVRPTGSSLGTIRLGAADGKIWFGWRVGIPAAAFKELTFSEAAAKADALGLGSIEGFDTQKVSPEVPKALSFELQSGERRAVEYRLRELNLHMPAYHVSRLGADADSRRKLFEFARDLGVDTIVTAAPAAALADLDQFAGEFGINVAIESRQDPKSAAAEIAGRSQRIGIWADTGAWMQQGVKPADGLSVLKDRIFGVTIRDRSALGAHGRAVTLGSGAADLPDFFLAAYRMGLKPLFLSIDSTGAADTYADFSRSMEGFEKTMLPAMSARVMQMLDSPAGKIRGPELLPADMRQKIDAATPRKAIVQPKKPRKLLVTDIQMYSGHGTIPHLNLLIELMAKYTGAFEVTFSNDPNLLKYPKIKEFDAVFLNSVCGMTFPEPDVREGILRYVREGGGIGGNHAVTFSNNDWPEFTEMMGMWAGAHHTEKQVIKIDDSHSPLTTMFGGKPFDHTDEFYHMPPYAPYSREKQHVLLSLDVERSDMATQGKFCAQCTRPDQDYALAWIKTYGKGRVYCTPLGHTAILYTTPAWTEHLLAAIQFILGDLDADTTPSARLAARK